MPYSSKITYSSYPLNIFIQHELLTCLENIVEEGKGDTLSNHKKEEVCKIQSLIFLFGLFQQPRLTLVWFSHTRHRGGWDGALVFGLYKGGSKPTETL
jgi:hypothetical protein